MRIILHGKIIRSGVPLVAAALIALSACSLGGSPGQTVDTPSGVSQAGTTSSIGDSYLTAQQLLDTFETKNYQGAVFTVATTRQNTFVPDEENAGLISTAVIDRNKLVEDKYNITIVEKLYEEENLLTEQKNASLSGTAIGNIIAAPGEEIAVMAQNKLLLSLYELPYFDPLADYMDVELVKSATVGNTMYAMYGTVYDIKNNLWAVFYNKDLLTEYSIDDPYDYVINGTWTWKTFLDMAYTAAAETVNKKSPDLNTDIYGYASYFNGAADYDLADAMWQSAGLSYLGTTFRSEKLTINIDIDVAESIRAYMKEASLSNDARYSGEGTDAIKAFTAGRILFYVYQVGLASTLIDSEASWGVAPLPKVSEAQEVYNCWVDPQTIAIAAAASDPDTEFTGTILRALCASSYEKTGEAVEETYLNYYLTDNRAAVMLFNYVFANPQLDPVHIYGTGMQELGKETTDIVHSLIKASSKIKSYLLSSSNLTLIEDFLADTFK